MPELQVVSPFQPTGDQPKAIEELVSGLDGGLRAQTLLGATGTGKTFTAAHVIAEVQRPTLVLAHNKTLAAQLYAEFKEFFPNNAVEYFVSYYDYYQPEAYVPQHDLLIEKSTKVNEQIDRLRLSATASLLYRRDVVIVASVSCIYGIGDPTAWGKSVVELRVGEVKRRKAILSGLVRIQYARSELDLRRGFFRARGDTIEVVPAYAENAFRIELFGDEIERIREFNPITGEVITEHPSLIIYPARQFIADESRVNTALLAIESELEEHLSHLRAQNLLVEAQRLEQRTRYDLEMIREVGFTSGIENYSRHMDGRSSGSPPWTLLDYFPNDYLLIIDESHMTLPQVRGMYNGDRSRKQTLVDFGFRLPSALDNRPLQWEEFWQRVSQVIFTSATPGPYENDHADATVQQIIRPTGILDPIVEIRPAYLDFANLERSAATCPMETQLPLAPREGNQIDDLMQEIARRVRDGQRAIVTTLTQKQAEDLAGYLNEMGIKAHYLHAEIDTLERVEILRDLRLGTYDVVVGINLLREGIDLPEVSLMAILDADKEGFLRSEAALIQIIGRAARHVEGRVIMYADRITPAIQNAISETARRREIQARYNEEKGIEPASIQKEIRDLTDRVRQMNEEDDREQSYFNPSELARHELETLAAELEREMYDAAEQQDFEKAIVLRDQMFGLRAHLAELEREIQPGERARITD